MFNFKYFCVLIFPISLLISISVCAERELSAHLNPGCPYTVCKNIDGDELKNTTVIHVEADGPSNTLHYIWDLRAHHTPSVLVALTELNTNVTIDWEQFLNDTPNTVSFTNNPIYTMTFLFTKIFVFNDAEDQGNFNVTNSSEINDFNTQMLTWVREDFHESAHQVEVAVAGDNEQLFGEGKIKLKLKCFGKTDHDVDFPHLLHSENVTQVDMEFFQLATNSSFQKPRLAAEVILIVDEANIGNQTFKISKRKTLDDEHTPGIFELIDISSPESFMASRGGYLQYRPVSYTHPERDVSTSTGLHLSKPLHIINPSDELNGTFAWSYYGSSLDKILVESFNVSFGNPDDGFYTRTKLNTWTFIMGYGAPPDERLSMFVVIVAAIGLGIPVLLLIGGGCYLSIKRLRNR